MLANNNNSDRDAEQLFDELAQNDPTFRGMLEALDHTVNNTDLDGFESALVASSALAAGDGLNEQEWLAGLGWDQPVQIAIRSARIGSKQLPDRLAGAIKRIQYYGLWPWS